MTTLSNLEQASDWKTAANLGNSTPGVGATASYGLLSGGVFWIISPGPYGNGYPYRVIPIDAGVRAARTFHYEYELAFPQLGVQQAWECEFQRQIARPDGTGADFYNWALQLDFVGGYFRHFDYGKKVWVSTGIKLPALAVGKFYKLALDGRLLLDQDSGKLQNIIDSFSFDGVTYPTAMLFEGTFVAGETDKFTHAVQMDTQGQNPPPAYQVVVRNMSLSYL